MNSPGNDNSRRQFRWPKEARDLVKANLESEGKELAALISRLVDVTGHPRWACRRFVRDMGIRWRRPYRAWTEPEQQRLMKLLDLHPICEICRILRRSESSVRHMLQRLGANAQMGKDSFTIYTLAVALHVRPETVKAWIGRGWLKARSVASTGGTRIIISAEDFCDFCKKHTQDAVGNRLTKERLEFVYHFAFPVSHAELLPVRESKKERESYSIQMQQAQEGECDDPGQEADGEGQGLGRTA